MRTLAGLGARLAENGFRWTSYYVLREVLLRSILAFSTGTDGLNRLVERLDGRIRRLELRHALTGEHTIATNYDVWQNLDWSHQGEEWVQSPEWKQSVIDEVMMKYIRPGRAVLEIGPGAGRWTEALQKTASRLTLVDLSDRCIELSKERFSQCDNIEFFVNDGVSLDFISTETIDFIWSFDVFVHISPDHTQKYLIEFSRVLRPGARAVIHHPKEGGLHGGWRSSMTAELFADMLRDHGLTLVTQFDSWGSDQQFDVRFHHDIITVFEKRSQ